MAKKKIDNEEFIPKEVELKDEIHIDINKTNFIQIANGEVVLQCKIGDTVRRIVYADWETFVNALDMRNAVYANRYINTLKKPKRAKMKIDC